MTKTKAATPGRKQSGLQVNPSPNGPTWLMRRKPAAVKKAARRKPA